MCMEISGCPLFWNIMVESVLLSKPNALSSQVSVKSIVWWVSLAGASLLNLRKCLDFVHREDCRQASSASTLTRAALEASGILWSPGQCSAVVLWACPGRGRREQPESKWSARKAWGYFPSRPEKKMIRKVRGPTSVGRRVTWCFPALVPFESIRSSAGGEGMTSVGHLLKHQSHDGLRGLIPDQD